MVEGGLENSARYALRKGSLLLWVTFFLSLCVNVLRLSGPLFIILVYDRVLSSRSEETLFALFAMLAVLLAVLGLLDYARKRIVARFAAQFQERLEQTILGAASQNDLFPVGRSKPATGLDEVDTLRGFFHSGGLISVMDFIWTPMFVTVVFFMHPALGYVCLGGVAVIMTLVFIRIAFLGGRDERSNESSKRITSLKNMVVASREVVRSQDMSIGFKSRWISARQDGRDNAIALRDWTSWFDHMSSFTVLLVRYSVLATGAYLALHGLLTTGAMVAAAFLVTRILIPVNRFAGDIPAISKAITDWKRLKKILSGWDKAASEPYSVGPGNTRVRLHVDGVSVKSPLTGAMVLRSVTLKIAPGNMVEIIGKTGQGKTALAETIVGIARRSAGNVLCDGINVAQMSDEEQARAIGYVPECTRFVAGTLADNISRLDPDATPEKVSAAARKACMHAWICALPDGYQSEIDASGAPLSKGQRQQLALARALYPQPSILIIDEPDQMLLERLPKTMKKTLDGILETGGVVLLLARKPLPLLQERNRVTLDNGKLGDVTRVPAEGGKTPDAKVASDAANVTVLTDKKVGKSGTSRVQGAT